MVFHLAGMIGALAGQVQQAPVVVHCVLPPSADSEWKQWIQPILNLVSIVAVAGIAIWSFGATSRKEHRRWVLDQKKVEWKALLGKAAEIEQVLPMVPATRTEILLDVTPRLKKKARELSEKRASSVFLLDVFTEPNKLNKFKSFIKEADDADSFIWAYTEQIDPNLTPERLSEILAKINPKIKEITRHYFEFIEWLRIEAAEDLGLPTPEQSGQD